MRCTACVAGERRRRRWKGAGLGGGIRGAREKKEQRRTWIKSRRALPSLFWMKTARCVWGSLMAWLRLRASTLA